VRLLPKEFAVEREYWEIVPRLTSRLTRVRALADFLDKLIVSRPYLTAVRRGVHVNDTR
jgi:hypothetical protein